MNSKDKNQVIGLIQTFAGSNNGGSGGEDATLAGNQTFIGQNTFSLPINIARATLPNQAATLGQLNMESSELQKQIDLIDFKITGGEIQGVLALVSNETQTPVNNRVTLFAKGIIDNRYSSLNSVAVITPYYFANNTNTIIDNLGFSGTIYIIDSALAANGPVNLISEVYNASNVLQSTNSFPLNPFIDGSSNTNSTGYSSLISLNPGEYINIFIEVPSNVDTPIVLSYRNFLSLDSVIGSPLINTINDSAPDNLGNYDINESNLPLENSYPQFIGLNPTTQKELNEAITQNYSSFQRETESGPRWVGFFDTNQICFGSYRIDISDGENCGGMTFEVALGGPTPSINITNVNMTGTILQYCLGNDGILYVQDGPDEDLLTFTCNNTNGLITLSYIDGGNLEVPQAGGTPMIIEDGQMYNNGKKLATADNVETPIYVKFASLSQNSILDLSILDFSLNYKVSISSYDSNSANGTGGVCFGYIGNLDLTLASTAFQYIGGFYYSSSATPASNIIDRLQFTSIDNIAKTIKLTTIESHATLKFVLMTFTIIPDVPINVAVLSKDSNTIDRNLMIE